MAVMGYCEDCKKPYYIDFTNSKIEKGEDGHMYLVTWCPCCNEKSMALLSDKIEVSEEAKKKATESDLKPEQTPV